MLHILLSGHQYVQKKTDELVKKKTHHLSTSLHGRPYGVFVNSAHCPIGFCHFLRTHNTTPQPLHLLPLAEIVALLQTKKKKQKNPPETISEYYLQFYFLFSKYNYILYTETNFSW